MVDYAQIPSACYVLEEAKLRKNLELMAHVQKEAGVDIILAFKGFAMWGAFPMVKQYLKGATASSLNEAKLCHEEMGSLAHTYCVAYWENELEDIAKLSSHLTFNSLSQIERLGSKAKRYNPDLSIGIRVNPEQSDVTTDLYNPSSPKSRLGMTSAHFGDHLPEYVDGLHFHVLCESTSHALEEVLKSMEEKFAPQLKEAEWVNMGGGHLMTREGYDVGHLIKILKAFKEKWQVDIILEPGSAAAWQTGDLVTTVLDIVENGGVSTAIIDASFTCHMPDCLEMPYRPTIIGAGAKVIPGKHHYRIGGLSCLAGDFMEEYSFDQPLQIGDQIIFEDMIHYTMVKTSTFNGVPHPSIGIWREDGRFDLLRSFGYEDYKGKLS